MNKIIIILIIILIVVVALVIWAVNQSRGPILDQGWTANDLNYNIQGMKVEILKEGSGVEAKTGNTVTVNYTGTLVDGTKFDSSLNPGRTPFEFTLGQNRVIQGWELGVLGMKVGEKRKLTIPPELGYGSQAVGGVIPANATLIFEIDLLGIN